MIGTADDAQSIAVAHAMFALGEPLPEGWTLLGQGQHRTAYLAPDQGTVYKVCSDHHNRIEHQRLTAWREQGKAWAPATSLHVVDRFEPAIPAWDGTTAVIAMPYIAGDDADCDVTDIFQAMLSGGAMDLNISANVICKDGQPYLIDAAGM